MKFLLIKPPQKNEYTIASSVSLFSSLITRIPRRGLMSLFSSTPDVTYSFNFVSSNQTIYFVVGASENDFTHLKNQVLAQYGKADVYDIASFDEILKINYDTCDYGEMVPGVSYYLPLKSFDGSEIDPIGSILSSMSRSPDPNAFFWVQMIVKPAGGSWQSNAIARINKLNALETTGQGKQMEIAMLQEKIKYNGFETKIRLITDSPANTNVLQNTFTVYSRPSGNSLKFKRTNFFNDKKTLEAIKDHKMTSPYILNTAELGSLWHIPNSQIGIPNIGWGKRLALDTPENLPVANENMEEEDKKNLTFVGKVNYKNRETVFGIKAKDRLRHVYIVGKTGSGKSSMIENMAIEDIRKGAGIAVLDPHGDAIDMILDYIPKNRINDVCYFNPADPDYAYPLNILEVTNDSQKELVVSGIIGIYYKLYANSWGPRMEHILRNVLFTLIHADNATLPDIVKILQNKSYRNRVLEKINDPIIHQFWDKEFDSMSENFKSEAISPILNKVGQFITSPMIRKVIAYPKSKVRIQEIMDNKKIFLCDLSQGKLGEDNAALLGAMLITQIQVCAMNRAFVSEDERVPFYLYVDEFQNFATKSFTKILSEARKYKLGLTLANQYITQIDEEVIGAILGNVGNIMTFNVGAKDADILYREFGSEIESEDLTTLNKFQLLTRITVDNAMTKTFTSYSLPMPKNKSGHREKIIEQSRKRYGILVKKEANSVPTEYSNDGLEGNQADNDYIKEQNENRVGEHKKTPEAPKPVQPLTNQTTDHQTKPIEQQQPKQHHNPMPQQNQPKPQVANHAPQQPQHQPKPVQPQNNEKPIVQQQREPQPIATPNVQPHKSEPLVPFEEQQTKSFSLNDLEKDPHWQRSNKSRKTS